MLIATIVFSETHNRYYFNNVKFQTKRCRDIILFLLPHLRRFIEALCAGVRGEIAVKQVWQISFFYYSAIIEDAFYEIPLSLSWSL